MCGIAGLNQNSDSSSVRSISDLNTLGTLFNSMHSNRGPDAKGIYIDQEGKQLLCHTRLSILDLDSRANQPMECKKTGHVISFNGEIYNFSEIKERFFPRHLFQTSSDTEVILEIYKKFGLQYLAHLRGMFAIAIWDNIKKELILIRDPLGIKPLYYLESKDFFAFSSTAKALYESFKMHSSIEEAGLIGFLLTGSVPEPWTIYKNIFSVQKGSYLRIKNGKICEHQRWLDFKNHLLISNNKKLDINSINSATSSSISSHLVSDVPVATFLSAGIDSLAVTSHAKENQKDITGININFSEFRNTPDDELPLAKKASKDLNVSLHSKTIHQKDFLFDLESILSSMDQPSIDGINTWYASKFASELGFKVVLSGVGGDEIFCGYDTFKRAKIFNKLNFLFKSEISLNFIENLIAPVSDSRKKISYVFNYLGSLKHFYFFLRSVFLKEELLHYIDIDLLNLGLDRLNTNFYLNQADYLDENRYKANEIISFLEIDNYMGNQLLRDSDWASMAHSIELRTPLVDIFLFKVLGEQLNFFKNKTGKRILAESPLVKVPSYIVNKPKTGFSFPLSHWLGSINLNTMNSQNQFNLDHLPWQKKWSLHLAKKFVDQI